LYAVTSVNYGYTGRERQAALISGAVAAGGSTWLAELYAWDFARWRDRHEAFQNSEQPLDYDDIVTWEAPYSVAKDLISAKVAQADQPNEHLHAAVGLLHRIIARYPHVSPPREELLLALLELDDAKEFERQKELAEKHIAKTHEYWCRLGRKEKEIGFAQLERGNLSLAISRLQQGEEFYSNGMELTADPYPLINVAAVCLYLAAAYHLDHQPEGSAEALKRSHDYGQQAMRILISSVSRPTTNSEAHFWSLATRAEAMLLAGQIEESARLYRQLPEHPACTPRNLETAERQKRKNEDAILMLSRSME
jgi:tetratricopeptide (TPR) repeat protein